ncbi:MAG: Ppx/GppA phosphatase family protein [Pirellulaceae bacterium]|jgi:exopolyphosphatase/guanosine-5'-triphosphate,3'-diphosphate pyrophosphatase|nr:Ppx/GppA phosphatase family protein [Pirellulaceae bacterium]
MSIPDSESLNSASVRTVRPVAVIDIGTSSIRMAIAEIDDHGGVRTLETLSQAVSLGKDTFTEGAIDKDTIEDCVRVLKSYRQVLVEYQIVNADQIRVVATSAVREARNRLAFNDRVYVATGLEVEPLDEAEVNRITYLGVQPFLQAQPALSIAKTIVLEVGGGSTELLVVRNNNVLFSHSYRLGSLRLRETLEAYQTPSGQVREIMASQIDRVVHQVREDLSPNGQVEMVALGGDVRFAASQLIPDWERSSLARVPLAALEEFTNEILKLSEDEIVRKHHISFPDADTLGPALLTYVTLARSFGLVNVMVSNANLRDGLLKEMATDSSWSEEFANQIIRSALDLGDRFDFDEPHAKHVAELSKKLFAELRNEHQLDRRHEVILYLAALLHEIGLYVSFQSHHKHAMYLIRNSELFGLGKKSVLLTALVARYYRRASPQPSHDGYSSLDRDDRVTVAKLAAILRVAVALDESRSQRIEDVHCRRDGSRLIIQVPEVDDLSIEQLALRQSGSLFEEIFGLQVLLRTGSGAG